MKRFTFAQMVTRSFRKRFLFLLLTITVSIFAAKVAQSYWSLSREVDRLGQLVVDAVVVPGAYFAGNEVEQRLKPLRAFPGLRSVAVYDDRGILLASFPAELPAGKLICDDGFSRAFEAGATSAGRVCFAISTWEILKGELIFFALSLALGLILLLWVHLHLHSRMVILGKPFVNLKEQLNSGHLTLTPDIQQSEEAATVFQSLLQYNERERLLMEENKKRELLAGLGRMAKQVAHDIRSPLSVIRICASKVSESNPRVGDLLSEATRRLSSIADDLLTEGKHTSPGSSDTEASQIKLVCTTSFDPLPVVAALVNEKIFEHGGRTEIAFECHLPETEPRLVVGESAAFERVLSNILNNAVEAIRDHGLVSITSTYEHEMFRINVKDNGIGIPKDIISKITAEGGTFSKTGGHGIGLSNAVTVLQSWGGRIAISSEVGAGTTVSIFLKTVLN